MAKGKRSFKRLSADPILPSQADSTEHIRALMKQYGVTVRAISGKKCIYADNVPQDVVEEIRQAVKAGKI